MLVRFSLVPQVFPEVRKVFRKGVFSPCFSNGSLCPACCRFAFRITSLSSVCETDLSKYMAALFSSPLASRYLPYHFFSYRVTLLVDLPITLVCRVKT